MLALCARAEALSVGIVTDPLTGVAIDGYDPVTYFIDTEPRLGRPDFEYVWQGVSWYFVSAANRDIFKRSPEVYAPQFGGHCMVSLARGFLSDGKPRLFVIEALKLYFFYSAANRDAFLMSKSTTIANARANWVRLSSDLTNQPKEAPPADGGDGGASEQPAASSEPPAPSPAH